MASILNYFRGWRKISIFFLSETSRPPKFLKQSGGQIVSLIFIAFHILPIAKTRFPITIFSLSTVYPQF